MIGRLVDGVGAIWVLLSLGVVSRFRFKGAYWNWRIHTAYSDGIEGARREGLVRSIFGYACWAWRIRRLR